MSDPTALSILDSILSAVRSEVSNLKCLWEKEQVKLMSYYHIYHQIVLVPVFYLNVFIFSLFFILEFLSIVLTIFISTSVNIFPGKSEMIPSPRWKKGVEF